MYTRDDQIERLLAHSENASQLRSSFYSLQARVNQLEEERMSLLVALETASNYDYCMSEEDANTIRSALYAE